MIAKAKKLSDDLMKEDGVAEGLRALYTQLPIGNMCCDVSMAMGVARLAHVFCYDCGLKMSKEVSHYLHQGSLAQLCIYSTSL